MPQSQTAHDILERHFLELRCGILDLGAALDRIHRAAGAAAIDDDPRLAQLQQGIEILLSAGENRAERIQLLFSDDYIDGWNQKS